MSDPTSTSGRRRRLYRTAMIVAAAMFMEQVDGTVLATALPAMAHSFGADPLHMGVALTAYLLSLAVFIPVSGTAADRFGARTVFSAAIALFTLGSILCGQANTLWFLILARIVQGIGGAMMVPVGRLVLLRTANKSELVMAMTWLMIPATIGPILGPPIGGFIVTYLNWRWIFYINVPIGVLGLAAVWLFIDDVREPNPGPFDLVGFVYSGVSLACLMFGIETASRGAGSLIETGGLVAVGLVSGVLYFAHSRRHPRPILDFTLMRIPTFGISLLAGSLSRIAVGATPFLLPMMLQLGFGLSAARSGLITFASAAGSLAVRTVARPMLARLGFRNAMIWVGLVATLCLLTTAAFRPSWPMPAIYAVLLVGGFFQSLQFMAYNTVCYADVSKARMSAATSFYTTCQQLCLSLGIATGAASLAASTAFAGHAQPMLPDFSVAFVVVGCVALFAPLTSARLPTDAGAELTGQRRTEAGPAIEPGAGAGPEPMALKAADAAPRRRAESMLEGSLRAARRRGRA